MASPKNKNEYALTLVEVVVAMAAALLLMTTFAKMITSKMNAVHSAKETGELRDIRALLKRQLNCPATLAAGNCSSVVNAEVRGIGCGGSDLINLPTNVTKMGLTELKVKCGTDIGPNRLLVEYRNSTSNNQWRDLNREIPWTCEPAPPALPPPPQPPIAGRATGGCAIIGGRVECWGSNSVGSLGTNSTNLSEVAACPVPVAGTHLNATQVFAGEQTTCANFGGDWRCWGDMSWKNDPFTGAHRFFNSPQNDAALNLLVGMGAIQQLFFLGPVGMAREVCALISGDIYCAGSQVWTPTAPAVSVETANERFSFFRKNPELMGTSQSRPAQKITSYSNVQSVAVSRSAGASCVLSGGSVFCEGSNLHGLTSTSSIGSTITTPFRMLSGDVTALSMGTHGDHACAVQSGKVLCWGRNTGGKIGDGSQNSTGTNGPQEVVGITGGATSVAAGSTASCAVVNGDVKCWGSHLNGSGGYELSPYDMTTLGPNNDNVSVFFGSDGMAPCVVKLDGSTLCWGSNTNHVISSSTSSYLGPTAPACGLIPLVNLQTPPPAAACGN